MSTSLSVDPLENTWPPPYAPPSSRPPAHVTPALSTTAFGLTDKGRERGTNEDRFLIAAPASALWMDREGRHAGDLGYAEISGEVYAVADGIGGHAGGGVASALAIETLSTFLLSTLKWVFALGGPEAIGGDMLEHLQAVLRWADSRVREEASRDLGLRNMGTTLTLVYRYGAWLYVGHVGDSRCYLLRDGELHQITRDHTVVAELVQGGLLTAAEAAHHPARHVITNALGPFTGGLQAEVHRVRVHPTDTLLLCTDGLSGVVPHEDIHAALAGRDPREACVRLVESANDLGGPDNVTAVVARYDAALSRPAPRSARRPSGSVA